MTSARSRASERWMQHVSMQREAGGQIGRESIMHSEMHRCAESVRSSQFELHVLLFPLFDEPSFEQHGYQQREG